MYLARDDVRRELGLTSKPRVDPDVRAGRLKVADRYLEKVLYTVIPVSSTPEVSKKESHVIARNRSAWDIAREDYNSSSTMYEFPDGSSKRGDLITDWNRIPPGTKVILAQQDSKPTSSLERVQVIGKDGVSASEIAGASLAQDTTIYFLTDGSVKQGSDLTAAELLALPPGTGMLVGFVHGGSIRANRRAFDICGPRWNLPTTFYRLPDGEIKSGDEMNERGIPNGTLVFFQP